MSNILRPHKYAYFVINESDDLGELQNSLLPYGGIEVMEDVVVDYAFDKRRIVDLINCCKEQDVIYTPYLARLGKSLKDLYGIVAYANERNVEIVFCDKPNTTFGSNSANGQINFAALKWAMELDFEIRSEYHRASTAKRQDEIERMGYFTTNSGKVRTNWGNKEGYDMSAARIVSSRLKTDAAKKWREDSQAVKFALRKRAEGWGVTQIADKIGALYDDHAATQPDTPNPYATPTGCKPSKGTISKWLRDMLTKNIEL